MRSRRRFTSVGQRVRACARIGERPQHALFGEAFAEARLGEHLVFDETAHARRLVGERALVELAEDACRASPASRSAEISLRSCAIRALLSSRQIEAQQRRLHFGVRAAPRRRRRSARSLRRPPRDTSLPPGFTTAASAWAPVMRASRMRFWRDRGHHALEALEVGEVVLAQRDQDAVVGAGEVETVSDDASSRSIRASSAFGRAILDEVGEVLDEFAARLRPKSSVCASVKISSNWSKMSSGNQRCVRRRRAARRRGGGGIPRATRRRPPSPRLRPVAGGLGGAEDRLLDLLGRRRRVARVVDAHVDRAEALRRSRGTMPARRIEVLPRPDCPKRIVSGLRCTRRASSAISSSRP